MSQAANNIAALGLGVQHNMDWHGEHLRKQAAHHRQKAVEIAQVLPEDAERAKAILADAIRVHALIHDTSASAVSKDLDRLLGK